MADVVGVGGAIGGEVLESVKRLENLVKEYSKSVEKLNKISGGFGLGLTKFGTVNAKLDILADRLDLNQKQNKELLAFETTFSRVLTSNDKTLKKLLADFGPKLMGETIQDALAAGGPILGDALELGTLMSAVGKDPAKMFKFLNEFKTITGFGASQQKLLVSSLKDNFARQDAVLSALQELISTMQEAAGLSPKIPENITKLINEFSKQFPGLETQFAQLFKTYLSDPMIARGYLGAELQQANKELVQGLMQGTLTAEQALSFIEKISNSPEIKARQEMFAQQATQTGLVQDSISGLASMLGDFVKEARQTNSAINTVTEQLKSPDVVRIDKLPKDQFLIETLKQLDITLDKVNSTVELARDDFAYLQELFQKLGFDLDYNTLPDQPKTLDTLADSINKRTEEQIKILRKRESEISDAYTTFSEIKDVGTLLIDTVKGARDVVDTIKDIRDSAQGKLGESCLRPMHVRLCGAPTTPFGGGKNKGPQNTPNPKTQPPQVPKNTPNPKTQPTPNGNYNPPPWTRGGGGGVNPPPPTPVGRPPTGPTMGGGKVLGPLIITPIIMEELAPEYLPEQLKVYDEERRKEPNVWKRIFGGIEQRKRSEYIEILEKSREVYRKTEGKEPSPEIEKEWKKQWNWDKVFPSESSADIQASLIKFMGPGQKEIVDRLTQVVNSVDNVSKTIISTKNSERYAPTIA